MIKRILVTGVFLLMSGASSVVSAETPAVSIYRCLVDDNISTYSYVPAYVCRNMGGKVIY